MRLLTCLGTIVLITACSQALAEPRDREFLVIKDLQSAKANELLLEIVHLKDSRLPCMTPIEPTKLRKVDDRLVSLFPAMSATFGTKVAEVFDRPSVRLGVLCRGDERTALHTYEAVVGELERRFR